MGVFTPNLGLYKPNIAEKYWGEEVDQNWNILDAQIYQNSLDIADILNNKLPPLQTDVAYNKTQISKIKKEMLTIALNVMMNKALLNAETKDFYSIIADVVTPDYPNGFKSTLILPVTGVTFDNDGGGIWTEAIKIPLTTTPSEHAQYKIVIQSNTMQIYAADGTLKAEYGAQTGIASDFWGDVKSDGSDIRLADQNYQQLYFYVEEFDYANSYAVIWVRIPAGTTELNIAYGNPSATKSSYEDPTQVFEFYDDFEGSELDTNKWTANYVNSVDYEVVNSNLRITDATKSGTTYWIYDNTDTGSQIKANFTVLDKMVIEWKQKMETQSLASQIGEVGVGLCKDDKAVEVYLDEVDGSGGKIEYRLGHEVINGQSRTQVVDVNADTYYILRIIKDGNNYKLEAIDEQGNVVYPAVTGLSTATISYMAVCVGATGGYPFALMQIDWVRVLKFADPAEFGEAETITLVTTGDFTTITFDFPEGVDKLLITVDTDATAVYYSTDDGQTWNPIQPDTETLLTETAYSVKWRFEFASYVRGYAFITW